MLLFTRSPYFRLMRDLRSRFVSFHGQPRLSILMFSYCSPQQINVGTESLPGPPAFTTTPTQSEQFARCAKTTWQNVRSAFEDKIHHICNAVVEHAPQPAALPAPPQPPQPAPTAASTTAAKRSASNRVSSPAKAAASSSTSSPKLAKGTPSTPRPTKQQPKPRSLAFSKVSAVQLRDSLRDK